MTSTDQPTTRHGIDLARLAAFARREQQAYAAARPRSAAAASAAAEHWHDGVPLHWMKDWGLPFPFAVASASGVTLTDVDGHAYTDFCLGDTGSMFGHAPEAITAAIRDQAGKGLTAMLPSVHTAEVGALLARRFGLPFWQSTLTATDANRAVIRWARGITRRRKLLVFNGCYHGAVDDAHVRLANGSPIWRPGLVGQVYDVTEHTEVVEFNDIPALEAALAGGDVALLLAEPVMTNIGMVLPAPGTHEAMRRLTRQYGTLLCIDETHTISTGPGGYTRAHGLEPDFFVLGKPVAGGVPAAVYGFTRDVSDAMKRLRAEDPGYSGMGTTLSANTLAMAAMRACLSQVMTHAAYDHMIGLANFMADGLRHVIKRHRLPWCVSQVGARVEYMLAETPPRNGAEAGLIGDAEIEGAIRTAMVNRGIVITPFHNMMLLSPATTLDDVERFVRTFEAIVETLAA